MTLRFIVLSCRDPSTDFRLPLVEALRRRGCEVHYLRLGRRPLLETSQGFRSVSLAAAIRHLRRISSMRGATNVYFTTTNLVFPWLILLLHVICAPGIWCFDMHDDLLYAKSGIERLRARIAQAMLLPSFGLIVHAASTLQELFPRSRHLGNASWLGRLPRSDVVMNAVLVLASIDERMDFALFDAVAAACPGVQFEVHGQVADAVCADLKKLLERRSNVRHHGAYVSRDLVPILERFEVMFAPYRIDTRLTRYLDPLRYYHALNSGMELISSGIPQALVNANRLHVVRTAEDFVHAFAQVQQGGELGRKALRYAPVTWDQRAGELLDILRQ